MDNMKRQQQILHTLFSENPHLAEMVRETDEEGIALYGQSYVQGVDFLVLTLEENLLISGGVYKPIRATMIMHPSIALNN